MEWSDERIETLIRLWREGFSASQVARQLGGVSRSAVIGKVHRLGIAAREAPSRPRDVSARRPGARSRPSAEVRRAPRPRSIERTAHIYDVTPTATILSLTEHGCRWPIGDPDEAAFGFCGRIRIGVGAYCAGHAPMATRRQRAAMGEAEIERLVVRFDEVQGSTSERAATRLGARAWFA